METSVEKIDAQTVRLNVVLSPEEVDKAVDAAYKRLATKVKVPGFRKGKIPKPVMDNQIGREAIVADAQDDLLSESYSDALDAEGLRPIAQPEIDDLDLMVAGEPFEYTATVMVRPELTLSSIEGLKVEVPPREVSEAEVDSQVDQMREKFATLEPVSDRGISPDDFVLLSFVGKVDGEDYEGNAVDKYLYEMGRGLMPDEFERDILGMEPGAETTVEFEIPDTSTNADFVGKTASFEVTIHEIKAKVLPDVDAEFAANAGGFDSVEDMRTSIREQFEKNRATAHGRLHERGARQALAERLEGEVPEAMIETTRNQITRDFANGLESREITMEQYLEATGRDYSQLEADFLKQAQEAMREELALEALFRQLEMTVTDSDIDSAIALMAAGTGETDTSGLRAKWEEAGVLPVIIEQIMHEQAVKWLMDESNVEVIEEEPSIEDEDQDSDTSEDA